MWKMRAQWEELTCFMQLCIGAHMYTTSPHRDPTRQTGVVACRACSPFVSASGLWLLLCPEVAELFLDLFKDPSPALPCPLILKSTG